jgi:hypothetical protein
LSKLMRMKNNYIFKRISDLKLSFIILFLFGIMPVIGVAQTVTFSSPNPAIPASTIVIGATKQPIYRAVIQVTGGGGVNMNKLTFTASGSFVTSDINTTNTLFGYRVWASSTDDLATGSPISDIFSTPSASGSPVSITINQPYWTSGNTYYLWITADISATAISAHTLTVGQLTTSSFSFTSGGITKTGTMSIGGVQTIGTSTGGANRYSVASGNWSSTSTWSATSGGTAGASVPVSGDNVYIEKLNTVTLNQHTGNLTTLSIASGSKLITTSNKGVSAITINLNGYYLNGSSEAVTGTLNVGAGATYEHNINGGVIPDATWSPTSLLKVTGITTTIAKLPNPIAGNVEWNCPNQSVSGEILDDEDYSIGGNFTLNSTGTGSVYLWGQTATGRALSIGGNYSQAAGNLVVDKTGDTDVHTINVYGNWSLAGGTFDCSGNTANVANVNIAGNYTQTAGTLTETSTGSGLITFTGNGTQTYSKTGGSITNTINFAIPTSRIVNFGTSIIEGAGTFTLSSGGNIITANTDGLTTSGATGSIQLTGTRTYDAKANYTFNGANQTIGNGVTAANNLILAGSGTKTFSVSAAVSNTLTINTSVIANLGTITSHTANTLNLGGALKTTGKWGGTAATTADYQDATYFGTTATGIVTISDSPCGFGSNTSKNIIWTPTVGLPLEERITNTFTTGQYININVIQGLTYSLYTNNNANSNLKMAVYNENGGELIVSSSKNSSSNPQSTNSKAVYLSFTSPFSGQIRVLINARGNCSTTNINNISLYSNVIGGENTLDSRIAYGATDTWIGHVYDGDSFNNYIGYYSPSQLTTSPASTDQFKELFNVTTGSFGSAGDCTGISFGVNSNSAIRANVLDEHFSVRYRMNSTRKGFWKVSLGSDDGDRLYIDNKLYYDWWVQHAPAYQDNILISLTGKSSLLLEYYQGPYTQCQIGFYNLTLIYANTLTPYNNTICRLQPAAQIIGQVQPSGLQTGFTFKSFQWYYSTTPTGTRIPITGETGANFTPNTTAAPFNASGTYYIYRNCTITSTTNVSSSGTIPASFDVTHESDPAILRVNSCINYWTGKESDQWTNANSWTLGVPYTGADVEFATTDNHANDPAGTVRDLNTIASTDYVLGSLKNETPDKALIINKGSSITVSDLVVSNNPDRILIKADPSVANGSLIFPNKNNVNVQGSVEMYSKAYISGDPNDPESSFFWQYFGVPVKTLDAVPTFYLNYVRRSNETGDESDTNYYWTEIGTYDKLTQFLGYELCQKDKTTYTFKGQLVNDDFDSDLLAISPAPAKYPGQYLFANSYTAAINIDKIQFGADMDNTVYLYNTGSYGNWSTWNGTSGNSPGQYLSVPQSPSGSNGLTSQIPSMSSFLVKTGGNGTPGSRVQISYKDAIVKNNTLQKVKAADGVTTTDLVSTKIDLIGQHYSDCMWIFTEASCTRNFDNGWDGKKMLGSSLAPQIFAIEPDGDYQVNSVSDMNNTDLAFQAGDEVEYTLKFTHENIQRQYAGVYLVDLVENKTVDVSENCSTYSFATAQSDAPAKRFKILTRPYEKGSPDKDAQVKIFTAPGRVFVHNLTTFKGECTLYDIAGRAIKNAQFAANAVTEVLNNLTPGAYVVNTITNGEKLSKRVIVQ